MERLPGRMRALIKAAAGPGLSLADVPVPALGPRDVLIRVERAGICGTDLHIHDWDPWAAGRVSLGRVIGHEFMGTVAATGGAVQGVRPGQRVSGEGHVGCGRCYCCRTGQGHICERVDIIGVDIDGCFAEYVRLPETNVWPLRPEIGDEAGALSDPLGNAMHTAMVRGVAGRTVLVMGAGAIGLLITAIAHATGALEVVVLDVNRFKLERARAMGADAVADASDPEAVAGLLGRTRDGSGFDVLLEASGSPAGIRLGLRLLRSGGHAALLGLPPGAVGLDLARDVIFKGLTLHGINGRRMYETWYQVEDLLIRERIRPEAIITHRVPLEDFGRAFELLGRGEAVKVLLEIGV